MEYPESSRNVFKASQEQGYKNISEPVICSAFLWDVNYNNIVMKFWRYGDTLYLLKIQES